MSKKRFQPEEIIGKLRHADVLLGQGKKIAEVVKALGVTDVTYSRRWLLGLSLIVPDYRAGIATLLAFSRLAGASSGRNPWHRSG